MKQKKIENYLFILSAILTVLICVIMNLFFIPSIERNVDGIRMFDMNTLGYTFEQARQFVASLQPDARDIYLTRQLPLDFFYPICYGCFFNICFIKLSKRKCLSFIAPLLLMVFDYGENVCSLLMLKTDFTVAIAVIGCICTVIKSFLMYIIILAIVVLFIRYMIKRKNTKT